MAFAVHDALGEWVAVEYNWYFDKSIVSQFQGRGEEEMGEGYEDTAVDKQEPQSHLHTLKWMRDTPATCVAK